MQSQQQRQKKSSSTNASRTFASAFRMSGSRRNARPGDRLLHEPQRSRAAGECHLPMHDSRSPRPRPAESRRFRWVYKRTRRPRALLLSPTRGFALALYSSWLLQRSCLRRRFARGLIAWERTISADHLLCNGWLSLDFESFGRCLTGDRCDGEAFIYPAV